MPSQDVNPFLLAASVPEPDVRLLPWLRDNPTKASEQDGHGYSLLHAAASYDHADLLRSLVLELQVDVNLRDEDGETCLFVSESLEIAQCLVEQLHIDTSIRNDEGQTAAEKIATEGDFPDVAAYLHEHASAARGQQAVTSSASAETVSSLGHPPPLPPNMNINFNTMTEQQLSNLAEQEPDPDFRRRIEDLASREDFGTTETQQELRDLITDAVRGVNSEERDVRRRVDSSREAASR